MVNIEEYNEVIKNLATNFWQEKKRHELETKLWQARVHELECNYLSLAKAQLHCCICKEVVQEAVSINCGHILCKFCLQKWRLGSNTCPECRAVITVQVEIQVLDRFVDQMYDQVVDEESKRQRRQLKMERFEQRNEEELRLLQEEIKKESLYYKLLLNKQKKIKHKVAKVYATRKKFANAYAAINNANVNGRYTEIKKLLDIQNKTEGANFKIDHMRSKLNMIDTEQRSREEKARKAMEMADLESKRTETLKREEEEKISNEVVKEERKWHHRFLLIEEEARRRGENIKAGKVEVEKIMRDEAIKRSRTEVIQRGEENINHYEDEERRYSASKHIKMESNTEYELVEEEGQDEKTKNKCNSRFRTADSRKAHTSTFHTEVIQKEEEKIKYYEGDERKYLAPKKVNVESNTGSEKVREEEQDEETKNCIAERKRRIQLLFESAPYKCSKCDSRFRTADNRKNHATCHIEVIQREEEKRIKAESNTGNEQVREKEQDDETNKQRQRIRGLVSKRTTGEKVDGEQVEEVIIID